MTHMNSAAWTYYNPVRLIVGEDSFKSLSTFIPTEGPVLLVTTEGFTRRGVTSQVQELLGQNRLVIFDKVTANPELHDLEQATQNLSSHKFVAILAVGGGSVIDAAKVLSVSLPSGVSSPLTKMLKESLKQDWKKNIPVIAVPTTSGTGAEVTPFATVWDKTEHKKYSVAGDLVFPQVAILDPKLTLNLPADQTLFTALDAISHALESLWNKNITSLSEAQAYQSLKLAEMSLPNLLKNPDSLIDRANMQQASMLAGLAISRTRTAIAHSVSYPLTSHFGVPHGLACSFTLPAILRMHLDKMSDRAEEKVLLKQILQLLENLRLEEKLLSYATVEQIQNLKEEMFTKGRADNFIFPLGDLSEILPK